MPSRDSGSKAESFQWSARLRTHRDLPDNGSLIGVNGRAAQNFLLVCAENMDGESTFPIGQPVAIHENPRKKFVYFNEETFRRPTSVARFSDDLNCVCYLRFASKLRSKSTIFRANKYQLKCLIEIIKKKRREFNHHSRQFYLWRC